MNQSKPTEDEIANYPLGESTLGEVFNDENVEEMATHVSDAVLKSEQAWDVLKGFYQAGIKMCLETRGFVEPVFTRWDRIKDELQDPVAFSRSFHTLRTDIQRISDGYTHVYQEHQNRAGEPTPMDWPAIYSWVNQYHALDVEFQSQVFPLMQLLMQQLENEAPSAFDTPNEPTSA